MGAGQSVKTGACLGQKTANALAPRPQQYVHTIAISRGERLHEDFALFATIIGMGIVRSGRGIRNRLRRDYPRQQAAFFSIFQQSLGRRAVALATDYVRSLADDTIARLNARDDRRHAIGRIRYEIIDWRSLAKTQMRPALDV